MIYLHWIVVLVFWLYVIVILATSAVVVMENRQPVKTMAWLLVLILLPVVAGALHLLRSGHAQGEIHHPAESRPTV